MSLINNALKKAQRQRSGDPAPLVSGGGGHGRRGNGLSTQTLILIGTGAAVLVAVSVVLTVYLLRSPQPVIEPVTIVSGQPATALSRQSSESDGGSTVPPVETDSTHQPVRPSSESDGGSTVVSLPTVLPSTVQPSPVVTLPTVVPPASSHQPVRHSSQSDGGSTVAEPTVPPSTVRPSTNTPAPVPDNAIYAYIDQLQVMGVRSSGTDSKVLMNDRVYRVNDIVNRELGLRLTKVNSDSLIFVDANGASYTKQF